MEPLEWIAVAGLVSLVLGAFGCSKSSSPSTDNTSHGDDNCRDGSSYKLVPVENMSPSMRCVVWGGGDAGLKAYPLFTPDPYRMKGDKGKAIDVKVTPIGEDGGDKKYCVSKKAIEEALKPSMDSMLNSHALDMNEDKSSIYDLAACLAVYKAEPVSSTTEVEIYPEDVRYSFNTFSNSMSARDFAMYVMSESGLSKALQGDAGTVTDAGKGGSDAAGTKTRTPTTVNTTAPTSRDNSW